MAQIRRRMSYFEREVFAFRRTLKYYKIPMSLIARRAGFAPSLVSRWLNFKVVPGLSAWCHLKEVLDVEFILPKSKF